MSGLTDDEVYIKEFIPKNKLSFSGIEKFAHIKAVNDYFELFEILNREQIYAVVPHNCRIN